jgi:hypothetical protein
MHQVSNNRSQESAQKNLWRDKRTPHWSVTFWWRIGGIWKRRTLANVGWLRRSRQSLTFR